MGKRHYSEANAHELESLDTFPLSQTYHTENPSFDHGKATFGRKVSRRAARFSGWRGGLVACITCTAFVLLLNLILAVVAATAWNPTGGIATAFTGDCETASRFTTAFHLVINILSSLLLGASNYTMQRLVSPTRSEIDKAHARKKWLDIGMPSVRNLPSIAKSRVAFWVLLGLSSMPLHFAYNSVVFGTIAANNVQFVTVEPAFFTDKNNRTVDEQWSLGPAIAELQDTVLDGRYLDRTVFDVLTSAECISRYTAAFITSGTGFGVPTAEWRKQHSIPHEGSSYYVLNSGFGEIYFPAEVQFEYCLSRKMPSRCRVEFSQSILYVVIACNVLKVAVMAIVLWRLDHETIVTIGDAVKSFLQIPDHTTEDCCLMSSRTINKVWKVPELRCSQRFYPKQREPWLGAISVRRWGICLLLCTAAIATAVYLASQAGVKDNDFGRVNVSSLLENIYLGNSSVIPYVLFANLPQAIISFIYLTYNGLFTCMLANREWAQYAIKRASLRVTIPSDGQRSTYFLQLPYTFSVPLLVASILLHWFISQAIFLARVAVYNDGEIVTAGFLGGSSVVGADGVFTGIGYSFRALVGCIALGSAMVAFVLLVAGICTYPKGLPMGGTNSAVISAACHVKCGEDGRGKVDESISDERLMWGVTIPGSEEVVGHCCFSSGEVDRPQVGYLYAGIVAKTKVA